MEFLLFHKVSRLIFFFSKNRVPFLIYILKNIQKFDTSSVTSVGAPTLPSRLTETSYGARSLEVAWSRPLGPWTYRGGFWTRPGPQEQTVTRESVDTTLVFCGKNSWGPVHFKDELGILLYSHPPLGVSSPETKVENDKGVPKPLTLTWRRPRREAVLYAQGQGRRLCLKESKQKRVYS